MFNYRWFFKAEVSKIINGQTLILNIDLGFGVWKKVVVRLNRIQTKDPLNARGTHPGKNFLETTLQNKQVFCRVFRKKDLIENERYFSEIFANAVDMSLSLKDLNKSFSGQFKIDGLININDLLVGHGLASYIQPKKEPNA